MDQQERHWLRFASLLSICVLSGCGVIRCDPVRWSQFHADAQSQGNIGVHTPTTLTLKWTLPTPPISYASPVIGPNGNIYVGATTGELLAVKPDGTGLAWSYDTRTVLETPTIVSAAAVAGDGDVYFLASGKLGLGYRTTLTHLRDDGSLKCSARLDYPREVIKARNKYSTAAPKLYEQAGATYIFIPLGLNVFVFNGDCQQIATQPFSCGGDIRGTGPGIYDLSEFDIYLEDPVGPHVFDTWYQPGPDADNWLTPTAAVLDKVNGRALPFPIVVVGQNGCGVHAFEWKAPPTQTLSHLWYKAALSEAFLSSPAISGGGQVVFGNSVGIVWSIDALTGADQWFYKTSEPTLATAAFYAGVLHVYAVGMNNIWLLDGGGLLTKFPLSMATVSSPSLSWDAAFLSSQSGMHALTPNLTTSASDAFAGGGMSAPAIGEDGTVYVSFQGGLRAYSGR